METQTCNELSADYIDIVVGSNDGLSVTVAYKSTVTKSKYYQLVGTGTQKVVDFYSIFVKIYL